MSQTEAERFQRSCHGAGDVPLEAGKEAGCSTVALFNARFLRSRIKKAVVRWTEKHIVMESVYSQALLMASSSQSQGTDGQE